MDEDKEVIEAMTHDNVMQSRYIKTGAFRRPAPEALDRTCRSFRESIYAASMNKIRTYGASCFQGLVGVGLEPTIR
jgi:hypothetical protein